MADEVRANSAQIDVRNSDQDGGHAARATGDVPSSTTRRPANRRRAAETRTSRRPRRQKRDYKRHIRGIDFTKDGHHRDGFVELPGDIVRLLVGHGIGLVHRCGRTAGHVRMDMPALSFMAGMDKLYGRTESSFTYHDGERVIIPAGEFILSIETTARAIATRLCIPYGNALYEQVRTAVGRLETLGLVKRLGPARPDKKGKASDCFGQRWTFQGTLLEGRELDFDRPGLVVSASLADLPDADDVLRGARRGEAAKRCDTTFVQKYAVATMIEAINHAESVAAHTAAAAKVGGLAKKESEAPWLAWQRHHASRRTIGASKHLSVGAFLNGQATGPDRGRASCTMPYLMAEIDGRSATASFEWMDALLGCIENLGGDLKRVLVAYSGNRSFHVRIPHGMIGRPVFRESRHARVIVREFFRRLCEPVGGLFETLDANLFAPTHLIRAIGSVHEGRLERTGEAFYCVAFTAEEIRRLDLNTVVQYSCLYSPIRMPDPSVAERCEAMVALFDEAVEHAVTAPASDYESRGIIERIKRADIEEGEEFAPSHVGRNRAALLYTGYLLTHGGMSPDDAWNELCLWNRRLPVPLSTTELGQPFASAKRFVATRSNRRADDRPARRGDNGTTTKTLPRKH